MEERQGRHRERQRRINALALDTKPRDSSTRLKGGKPRVGLACLGVEREGQKGRGRKGVAEREEQKGRGGKGES